MVTDHVFYVQINEHIASCLDSDEDIQHFRLICQATNIAVTHHRCGLWRELYARRYDVRPGMKGVDVRMTYMIRTRFLRRINPFFYIGREYRELVCLEKLRDLVVGEQIYNFHSLAHTLYTCVSVTTSSPIKTL